MSELAFRSWWLNKHFAGDELALSQRVTEAQFHKTVAEAIRLNMQSGLKLVNLTKELKSYTVVEDLPKGIKSVISMARQVSAGDASLMNKFLSVVNAERYKLEERLEAQDVTALTKSYNKLLNAAENLNEKGLEAAVGYAIEQKAAANAFRIAITESARAYGVGMRTRAMADEDCTGIMWDVSLGENNCDDCLALDGKVFPKDELPDYPLHPRCVCNLTLYFGDDVESQNIDVGDDSTIPEDFLDFGGMEE